MDKEELKEIRTANLLGAQGKHKKINYQHRQIPMEKINTFFSLMAEGTSLMDASKQAKIAFATARKYFERGDPLRGIKPLKFRLMVYREKIQKKSDASLLKRRTELLGTVMKAIHQLQDQVDAGVLAKKASLTQLDRLIRLEMYLRGIGNEGIERTQASLTAEDVRLLDGEFPGSESGGGEAQVQG